MKHVICGSPCVHRSSSRRACFWLGQYFAGTTERATSTDREANTLPASAIAVAPMTSKNVNMVVGFSICVTVSENTRHVSRLFSLSFDLKGGVTAACPDKVRYKGRDARPISKAQ